MSDNEVGALIEDVEKNLSLQMPPTTQQARQLIQVIRAQADAFAPVLQLAIRFVDAYDLYDSANSGEAKRRGIQRRNDALEDLRDAINDASELQRSEL